MGLKSDEWIKRGAHQVIQQAIEAGLAELLATHANVVTLQGIRAVVRKGYLPERDVLTAAGSIALRVPKVAGSRGVRRQVQLEHCAAVCTQIAPCIGGAALAVSERHIHGRHG